MSSTTVAAASDVAVRQGSGRLRLLRDRILLFSALLLFWEIGGRYWIAPVWCSRPSLIAERRYALALSGDLLIHTWTTLTEAFLGLALAFVVGLPIGMAMARYRYANEVAGPLVMALYS